MTDKKADDRADDIARNGAPQTILIDARSMQPPEPLERIMEALCDLQPGQKVRVILRHEPVPLYRILQRNGHTWRTIASEEGRFEMEIA